MNPLFRPARAFAVKAWLPALLSLPWLASPAPAQQLYMPRTVRQAYANGTRSPDGRPGPRYWQNRGRYTITLTATPPERTVRGTEQIVYVNNSPDTLSNLVIKLFLNIHKPGAPRNGGASDDYLTSGIHIDRFAVNGTAAPWQSDPRFFTSQPVRLPAPLMPHDSVRLAFDWHYEISREAGREGMLDATTWYLAYFYPRVAVYDDYEGWDTMDFTDQQEFYSDFNDYDVTIRVPANFIVWGTGTLLDPQTVLQPAALARYQASFTSDTTIRVATREDLAAHRVTLAQTNDWHFRARDIPDMAFGLSDHYHWDAASVVVDDAAHRRASVQAAYHDSAADFHYMTQFGRHALDRLSHHWPGVPYPYEKSTIFLGTADMEYPMMVNDNSFPDTSFSRFVAEHEIAHTYFPFYMGINETRYGFMDEGWATTFEYLVGVADMGAAREDELYRQFRVNRWITDPSPLEDLPIITPGDVLKGPAYGNNAYGKASLGYLAVKDMLGDALFARALHAFMDRWHGRHPTPWDFFNTFNDASGRDLNWFWNNWFFGNGYIDLAVGGVTRTAGGYAVVVNNVGGMAAPVDLRLRFTDGTTQTVHQTPAIWQANQRQATVTVSTSKALQSLDLDGGIWMDATPADNHWAATR
ncbi:M1 family metallopeptidase [Longimicrobium sp.]|uniref:M1 family metallopeptidase n=1 Tax=Longimicrobium sp. TaxID=2029185 RepID=UPI002BCA3E4E|nr:M1 family metallopeptidase [Longimicrobium sp.]HSU15021.1 M1 family metallopeptidase [Longimicrobium sp.]